MESSIPISSKARTNNLLQEAFENYYNNNFEIAANLFQQYISENVTKAGLFQVEQYYYLSLLHFKTLAEISAELKSLINSKLVVNDITELKLLRASILESMGNYNGALKILESVESTSKETEICDRAKLQKALLLIHSMDDFNRGSQVLENLVTGLSTDSYIYEIAASELKMLNSFSYPKKNKSESVQNIVKTFSLDQNYPNPFNPSTRIRYQIPNDGYVTLKVYDILGKEITTLVEEAKTKGKYDVVFDASSLSSGVYIYTIDVHATEGKSFRNSKKMLLLK